MQPATQRHNKKPLTPEEQKLHADFTQLWNEGKTYKKIAQILQIPFTKAITLRPKLNLTPRMTTRYSTEGKIQEPMTDKQFTEGMEKGTFKKRKHKGYIALLFNSAVRKWEAGRATKEQFTLTEKGIIFQVGKRLKHGIETPPLFIPYQAPYAEEIKYAIEITFPSNRVFPYSNGTLYNIVRRVFKYPHFFRLSRITNFFLEGWTIAQVHSWTGLTLSALEYYVGLVDTKRMGESLAKKQRRKKQQ